MKNTEKLTHQNLLATGWTKSTDTGSAWYTHSDHDFTLYTDNKFGGERVFDLVLEAWGDDEIRQVSEGSTFIALQIAMDELEQAYQDHLNDGPQDDSHLDYGCDGRDPSGSTADCMTDREYQDCVDAGRF